MSAETAERYRTATGHTVVIDPHDAGWWRWSLYAANGAEQARSTVRYSRKDAALRAARRLHPEATPEAVA